jgi:hypothetical protein
MSYSVNYPEYLTNTVESSKEKTTTEKIGKRTTTETSAVKGLTFAMLAAGIVIGEAVKTVLRDATEAYLFERLPTKSSLLKTTF